MLNYRSFLFALLVGFISSSTNSFGQNDNSGELHTLPDVADEFLIEFVAKEPLTRNPCAMAFDFKGQLFVGMGPQYRSPKSDTPGDSVFILSDNDGDGKFDTKHEFATGFNNIQGLCWHGSDLWIANAPDLTVVKDTDGDNIADKYIRLYTDLGNLEHGLHGLTWGPDGRMYMSKGNSKGHNGPKLFAPEPFHDLAGIPAPPGTPVFPEPRISAANDYIKTYHDPTDDWGREGGVLSCLDMGHDLRIESRGYRNPWDIAFDDEFNFIGTDNDQDQGDRVFHSFYGAHYGWGHKWSANWRCDNHLPTPELVGPMFGGSGTGTTYFDSPAFPPELRGVWMFNDWLQRRTHFFRTEWQGAQLALAGDRYDTLVSGGKALYKPTDLEIGPDGNLYILGWGKEYGVQWNKNRQQVNEGRIFRVRWQHNTAQDKLQTQHERWEKPLADWSTLELIDGLNDVLAVRRIAAQEELIQRADGPEFILMALKKGSFSTQQSTWALWAFIRSRYTRQAHLTSFYEILSQGPIHQRIQALRCLRYHTSRSSNISNGQPPLDSSTTDVLKSSLTDQNARIRFEAYQFITRLEKLPHTIKQGVLDAISRETDPTCFYASWHVLQRHLPNEVLHGLILSNSANLKLAGLLAAAEQGHVDPKSVSPLLQSESDKLRETAALWMNRHRGNSMFYINTPGGEFSGSVNITLLNYLKPSQIFYTLDGSTPDRTSRRFPGKLLITKTCTLKLAIYSGDKQIGPVAEFQYKRISSQAAAERQGILNIVSETERHYQVSSKSPTLGQRPYTDRAYQITAISPELTNTVLLRTPNDDAEEIRKTLVTVELVMPTTVYIGHDKRIAPPRWLDSWDATNEVLATNDTTFKVFRTVAPAGELALGPNRDTGRGGASQYIVFLRPGNLTQLPIPTTIAAAKSNLETADVQRGQALFFANTGAGCHKCHRATEQDNGNGFGPNLAFLKSQKDVSHILESLLEPSAKIKEGFGTQLIITKDGKMISGILRNETEASVILNQSDGKTIIINRSNIDERTTQKVSAMPAFDRLLTPQQVADLAAFLLQQ
ncbi:MAG: PVC-type heme-binding CxxCH protein [Planctomycetaceae bacterium]